MIGTNILRRITIDKYPEMNCAFQGMNCAYFLIKKIGTSVAKKIFSFSVDTTHPG